MNGIFYGWRISAIVLAGNMLLQGATLYCMNALMEPLCQINDWSRMELNFSIGVSALAGQIAMPVAAAVSRRFSLRILMSLGGLAGGLATCSLGLTDDIRLFTLFLIVMWAASQFCGGVVGNALISNWFVRRRGMAFGIANSGLSLGGIFLPFSLMIMINYFNVTTACVTMGTITCLLCPLSWLYIRATPQSMGLHPDGEASGTQIAKDNQKPDASMKNLLARPPVWGIGISFGLVLMCGTGMVSQLKPRFSDLGMDAYAAMLLAALTALGATVTKYLWGWVCDRFSPIFAARVIVLACLLSFVLLFLPPNNLTLTMFAIFYSLCSGGMWVVFPALISYYFGGSNFLAAFELISFFLFLRCAGFPIMGISHEYFSSYIASDIIFACAYLLAFIMLMLLRQSDAVENRSGIEKSKN